MLTKQPCNFAGSNKTASHAISSSKTDNKENTNIKNNQILPPNQRKLKAFIPGEAVTKLTTTCSDNDNVTANNTSTNNSNNNIIKEHHKRAPEIKSFIQNHKIYDDSRYKFERVHYGKANACDCVDKQMKIVIKFEVEVSLFN